MREMDGTPGQPTPIGAALLLMRLLYAALLASVVIYVVIVHIIPFTPVLAPDRTMTLALAIVAGVLGLAAPVLRRVLMPPREPDRLGTSTPTHIHPKRFARTFAAHIVGWALCEAVVVIGLAMAFMTREASTIYPFAGGAVLMFLFLAPRRSELEAVARAEQIEATR